MSESTLPPRNAALEPQLLQALKDCAIGRPCLAFDAIPSTMDLVHTLAIEDAEEGTCVWTETQTAGRGRVGRTWVSPSGGLYISILLRPSRILREVPQLALIAGLAISQAIREQTDLDTVIRWPNDVLLRGRKVAGVLCETKARDNKIAAIIGIGVNVTTDPKHLPKEGTSLAQAAREPDRIALFASLCRRLDALYRQWNAEGFAPLKPALVQHMLFGSIVHITAGSDSFQGQTQDVDEQGRLVVRLDSGILRAVEVGEVTLLR